MQGFLLGKAGRGKHCLIEVPGFGYCLILGKFQWNNSQMFAVATKGSNFPISVSTVIMFTPVYQYIKNKLKFNLRTSSSHHSPVGQPTRITFGQKWRIHTRACWTNESFDCTSVEALWCSSSHMYSCGPSIHQGLVWSFQTCRLCGHSQAWITSLRFISIVEKPLAGNLPANLAMSEQTPFHADESPLPCTLSITYRNLCLALKPARGYSLHSSICCSSASRNHHAEPWHALGACVSHCHNMVECAYQMRGAHHKHKHTWSGVRVDASMYVIAY